MPSDRTADAEDVLVKDPLWVAPVLWRSEMRSVLNKYVQRGDVTVTRAVELFEHAVGVLDGRELQVDTAAVLQLAARGRASTYDCEFVLLAMALGVPLVTADRALIIAFPECAISARQFLDR
jgi:predicted nucleic acid-binding protein